MRFFFAFILISATLSCDNRAFYKWDGEDIKVAIVPFGNVSAKRAADAKAILEKTYHCQVTILKSVRLPDTAWYEPRQRYRAERLIQWLSDTLSDYQRVVGLTEKDIAIGEGSRNWGVFGYGYVPGRSCVISTFRLVHNEPGLLKGRFEKVVTHEFGHTLGLDHCDESKTCYMRAAKGKIQTIDEVKTQLCEVCRAQLGGVVR